MSETISTIGSTIYSGRPVWYRATNFAGGVSHLYVERTQGDWLTTLCGLSNEPGEASVTAKHCAACSKRLRAFIDAAIVEHEHVVETVTLVVTRRADDVSAEEAVSKMADRRGKWVSWSVESAVTPVVNDEAVKGDGSGD